MNKIAMNLKTIINKLFGIKGQGCGVTKLPLVFGSAEIRLLVTIDYAYQPYSIGDLLVNQIAALVSAENYGVSGVDFCFISDPKFGPQDPNMRENIRPNNRWMHMLEILPIVQLMPGLGSAMIFDSREMFCRYLAANRRRYRLWPTLEMLKNHEYLYYPGFRLIADYFNRQGRVPQLNFNDDLVEWTASFYKRLVYPSLPVTINLRNNKLFHHHRNSNITAWKSLFDHCDGRYPVIFIIICSVAEIVDELRVCPNVLFAKDQHTTVVQDLALIRHSIFHLGASSGPAILPTFYSKPYYISNCDALPYIDHYHGYLIRETDGSLRFSFAGQLQRFGVGEETSAGLIMEYERIWHSRPVAAWAEGLVHPIDPATVKPLSWLA